MSCYFRHIKDVFAEAGVEVDSQNRRLIDQAIHQLVGTDYKDCPATWKALKQSVLSDEKKRRELVQKIKAAVR